MNILVTGAKGMVGTALVNNLKNLRDGKNRTRPELLIEEIYEYDIDSTMEQLDEYCGKADFVFHLAGVNRPKQQSEFMEGNFGFSSTLLDTLKKCGNKAPIMLSSSIQATLIGRYGESDYGRSKLAGEELFFSYAEENGEKVAVYRFPNLMGHSRPNYNSAVSTFCNAVANPNEKYCYVLVTHKVTLGEIVDLLELFKAQPRTLLMPKMPEGSFAKKLYSLYLTYLPKEKFKYDLQMNADERGSFTELLHTQD